MSEEAVFWGAPKEPTPLLFQLVTGAEIEVLTGLSRGMSNKEIAESIGVGIRTVKAHINRMALKGAIVGNYAVRIRLAKAWAEYSRQYQNCEIFALGIEVLRSQHRRIKYLSSR